MKHDIHKHGEQWEQWKAKSLVDGILAISSANSRSIMQYLLDMELGVNISSVSVKGPRTPARLNILRSRMVLFAKKFEACGITDLTSLTEEQLFSLFADLRSGAITTVQGRPYQSLDTLTNVFKAFWHWHQKVSRKRGLTVRDITVDLPKYDEKPKWVYLNESQVFQLCRSARHDYQVLFTFIIDSGIRTSELVHLKMSDLYGDCKELHIRHEIAKKGSFGRRIKLMLCRDLLLDFCKMKQLQPDDYLFSMKPFTVNKYLKGLATRLFGDHVTEAGKRFGEISLYDLRHNSCCYWLPRYKSESSLKYRFGWKKSDMIHYYSELLGMRDTIAEEDLLIDVNKTELERRLVSVEQENQLLKERLGSMEQSFRTVDKLARQLEGTAAALAGQRSLI